MSYLYRLYHPEIFQGNLRKNNYFEGWYYKLVTADESHAMAIIPGVSIGREEPDHAFVQLLDGVNCKSYYYRYPIEAFQAAEKELDVRIGNNHFILDGLTIDTDDFKGTVQFSGRHPLPTSLLSPGIMGWYSFTPMMECYHGVMSMHHRLAGRISNGKIDLDFNGGIGYHEKDWGTSFPRCWIWAHSNHFDDDQPISLMASVAHIPWKGHYFIGFIVSFLFQEEIMIFATYNGSRKKVFIEDDHVLMSFKRKDRQLDIIAHHAPGADLRSPIQGLMTGKVNESLQARLEVTYSENGKVLYSGEGTSAGLEVAGDTDILMSKEWSRR
ncbi:MAG: hypothetical protein HKN68_04260 [Saprospiraceae bacterium]|nr:hypothetical protein [Saprospiraceae bacterium]